MVKGKNYYEILGLAPAATNREIKTSYRKLAQQYHPDANDDEGSREVFEQITVAYKVLSDKDSRVAYDAELKRLNPYETYASNPFPHQSASSTTAGRNFASARGRSGTATEATSSHRFHRSQSPTAILFTLSEKVRSYWQRFAQVFTSNNTASSKVTDDSFIHDKSTAESIEARLRGERPYQFTIDTLESLGESFRELAIKTNDIPQVLRVRIPAGVADGDIIRIRNPQAPQGLIRVEVHVHPHPHVERIGDDIILNIPLTISEAIYGTELDLPTLQGQSRVRIPPQGGLHSTEKRLRLSGRGLKRKGGGSSYGDLYVQTYITCPDSDSEGLREALKSVEAHYRSDVRKDVPKKLG